jgi:hypothetical protein
VRRHWIGLVRAGAALAAAAAVGVTPASALPANQFGVFPTWTTAGQSGAFSATAAFAPSAGFPSLSLNTNSTTIRAPTGESAWLGDSTAFGQEFGSSRSQPYLSIATAAGVTNSTTTLSFGGTPPSGWGFALGDIDADWVFVQGWQDPARTIPVTVAQLGFQGAGNYCNNTPKPSACATGPFTDVPVWVTAPQTFDGINYVPGTLRGNSLPGAPAATRDTSGAYGWFKPTVPIRSMDLTFGPRDGLPNYQLWVAAPAPKTVISGTVALTDQPSGAPVPAGTTATLDNADGTAVLDIEDQPVSTPVAPDGTFGFEAEQRDIYQIVISPPAGYAAPPAIAVAALAAQVTVPPITLTSLAPPTTEPAPTPAPASEPAPEPEPALRSLPPTGSDLSTLVVSGALVILLGLSSIGAAHRARHD